MIIKPLGKRILIKKGQHEEVTKSGIVLPGTVTKDESIIGEVLAIGSDITEVKVGEKIIYEKYSGTEVKDGDESYLLLEIENVLAIVE